MKKESKNIKMNNDLTKKIELLESEIKELATTIDKVEDEKLVIENQMKKALADYSNLERDIEKRVEIRSVQTKLQIAQTMLNVLDDISFAMSNSEKLELSDESKRWVEGVKATLFDIEKAVAQFGIVKMEINKGDSFDSSRHEALGTVSEGVDGTIYDIVQPGFMFNDVIVRPARVIISKSK
ncbi:MAG TPA: nucleotide exchange factor GrpE [Candidatus Dojkabacteria bacterium]|nr:nucleotide exchange factor GrpE [Candidatus Dojkabacteria bacterium]